MVRMFRLCFLLLSIQLIHTNVSAQSSGFFDIDNNERRFAGGLIAGANFSTVVGDGYGGYHKVGFVGGGVVYTEPVKNTLISIELLYSQRGSRGAKQIISNYTGAFFERFWLDLNYVEVPLLVHYCFSSKWHIGIGASYAQLLNSREEIYTDQPVTIDPDLNSFNKEDFNFIVSGGIQFGKGLFLMARYQRSLSTIRQLDHVPVWQGPNYQFNDMFSLRLMYLLH